MSLKALSLVVIPIEYDAITDNAAGEDEIFTPGELLTIKITVYIEMFAELAFNTLMILYLVQPYREARLKHKDIKTPSKAVSIIAGRQENLLT